MPVGLARVAAWTIAATRETLVEVPGSEFVENVVFRYRQREQSFEMECFRHFGRYSLYGIGSGPFAVFGMTVKVRGSETRC